MGRDLLRTEHMAVGYGKIPLLCEVELHVRQGEIVTLVGPNGAGKSTILRSIARQLRLLGGSVYLGEKSLASLSPAKAARQMGVLTTGGVRPELMTCEELVGCGRYPYTGRLGILSREDWNKVHGAMELTHTQDLAERRFDTLSDGQRQRILLARAICQEPEVLVLDEPTTFLDIRHKLELLTILRELVRERGIGAVISLHELDLAQRLSDYVVCVTGDRIGRCGPPEEILTSSYIEELYGIEKGSYDARFGGAEFPPVKGTPKVFVIGGNGSGIPVYRRLHRQNIPFAAGILHVNDIDYPVARALAAETVAEAAFSPICEETYERAEELARSCEEVICCLTEFGTMNEANRRLAQVKI
ncbi:ABC transporter ATP-binding protein [Clostridiaceae bacterium]|jgi:iron complex transport system ATP-binding protein|nr:ABC transporter ATP-binding protein [Clostridium sp.]NBI70393.1 ABC transporter ATP-binding protein [Clostridiaceae bacterium]